MKIAVVRMHKLSTDGACKAFLDVVFDDMILVAGCQVVSGPKGLFGALPSQKSKDGKYYPVVKLKDDATRNAFSEACVAAYEKGAPAAAPSTGKDEEVPF